MSRFETLMTATGPQREALLSIPFIVKGAAGQLGLDSYIGFLTQAYHHVRHTTPLLMACGARLPADREWLREAMAHYIDEELGHQEWILRDLAACGADAEQIRDSQPAVETELMIAYAWDLIQRRDPVGFLGMVLVLEGTSVRLAGAAADNIQQTLGLPDQAFSYLRTHGELDQSHMQFYAGLVNRLEAPDTAFVIHTAQVFYRLYGDIFRALPQQAGVATHTRQEISS